VVVPDNQLKALIHKGVAEKHLPELVVKKAPQKIQERDLNYTATAEFRGGLAEVAQHMEEQLRLTIIQ